MLVRGRTLGTCDAGCQVYCQLSPGWKASSAFLQSFVITRISGVSLFSAWTFAFRRLTLTPGTCWAHLESGLWNPCLFSYIQWQHQSNPCQPCPDPIAMGCVCIISLTLKCQVPLSRVFRLPGQKLEHAGILSTPNIVIHSWALLCLLACGFISHQPSVQMFLPCA